MRRSKLIATLAIAAVGPIAAVDASASDPATLPDVVPPETEIVKGPRADSVNMAAKFKFSSSEPGTTFECRLDVRRFEPCESGASVHGLDDGRHKFRVRAIDAAGNADPSPAIHSWSVKFRKR